ncbi:MAG: sugar phosphate isomerase/epimerase [Chloroflexi bacterium]|nr:MAG: sugar phosphate isomerase/epimerase [Chloroflexota bacterium]
MKRKNLDERLPFASSQGLGLEILDLTDPGVVHDDWQGMLRTYRDALQGFRGRRSIHGPFFDMYLNSADPEVRRVAERAYDRTLRVAEELAADDVIFHSNLLPMIKEDVYVEGWVNRHVEFWRAAVEGTTLTIALENLWDPVPELLARVVDGVGSARFGLCLDIGHCFNHSPVPAVDWIRALRDRIKMVHVSDSNGRDETPLAVRKGAIPWDPICEALATECGQPDVGLEVESLAEMTESLDRMRQDGLYPFQPTRA